MLFVVELAENYSLLRRKFVAVSLCFFHRSGVEAMALQHFDGAGSLPHRQFTSQCDRALGEREAKAHNTQDLIVECADRGRRVW